MHFILDSFTPCFFAAPQVAVRVMKPQTVYQDNSLAHVSVGLSIAPCPAKHAINSCGMNERMNDSFLVWTLCFMKPPFCPFLRAHCGSASLLDSNSACHLRLSLGQEPNSTLVQFNQLPWSCTIGRKHSQSQGMARAFPSPWRLNYTFKTNLAWDRTFSETF